MRVSGRTLLCGIARWCHLAVGVPLLALVAITTVDVVARYLLASSVPDAAEMSAMLLGVTISLSLAFTTLEQQQVRFDLAVKRLSPRWRAAADAVAFLLSAALFLLIAWQSVKRSVYSRESGEYVGMLEIPVWPAKLLFAFCCLLTALALLLLLVQSLRQMRGSEIPSRSEA